MRIPKPDSCIGCPFYAKSQWFTPDKLTKSNIAIIAQAPGKHEEDGRKIADRVWHQGKREEIIAEVEPQPLIGPTGKWIEEEFWPLTKLGNWDGVGKCNILKCRPHDSNDLPDIKSRELRDAISHCTGAHLVIPDTVRYVLALGQISLYALTKQESVTDWRGYVIGSEGVGKVSYGIDEYYEPNGFVPYNIFSTLHPASLFQPGNKKYDYAVRADFVKFGEFIRGTWPIELPDLCLNLPTAIPKLIGFDTEYDPTDNNRLIMWSMADTQGHVWVIRAERSRYIDNVEKGTVVFTQNGLVDRPHLIGVMDIEKVLLEDTMLMDSVLWTGRPHDLNYLCSIHGRYNRHKHLSDNQPELYAGLDADTTLNHVGRGLMQQFRADPISWKYYVEKVRPLLEVINNAQEKGIMVYQERVGVIRELLEKQKEEYLYEARCLTGKEKFNLGSTKQVGEELYGEEN